MKFKDKLITGVGGVLFLGFMIFMLMAHTYQLENRAEPTVVKSGSIVKVRVSCAARNGEASSSCCDSIDPVFLKVEVFGSEVILSEVGKRRYIKELKVQNE